MKVEDLRIFKKCFHYSNNDSCLEAYLQEDAEALISTTLWWFHCCGSLADPSTKPNLVKHTLALIGLKRFPGPIYSQDSSPKKIPQASVLSLSCSH